MSISAPAVTASGDLYGFSERLRFHTFKLGVNFLLPWAVVARN
jgi:hypothetical protein